MMRVLMTGLAWLAAIPAAFAADAMVETRPFAGMPDYVVYAPQGAGFKDGCGDARTCDLGFGDPPVVRTAAVSSAGLADPVVWIRPYAASPDYFALGSAKSGFKDGCGDAGTCDLAPAVPVAMVADGSAGSGSGSGIAGAARAAISGLLKVPRVKPSIGIAPTIR